MEALSPREEKVLVNLLDRALRDVSMNTEERQAFDQAMRLLGIAVRA